MHVTKSIVVARPRYEVYAFWRDFENLPRFMHHLESVTNIDGGRTHWVAKSIAGRTIEWDALLVEDRLNERIAWRTDVAGDEVRHAGAVTFLPHGSQATEVEVDVTYDAPGGRVGRPTRRTSEILPKSVAPSGHASAQAGCSPRFCLSWQNTHFRTYGVGLLYWYFGMSNGQAIMQ